MERELQTLLSALEDLWVDPNTTSQEELAGLLVQRQGFLDRLQQFDTSVLSNKDREQFAQRLKAVMARDQSLHKELQTQYESLLKQGDQARASRRSAEGYRRLVDNPRSGLERIA